MKNQRATISIIGGHNATEETARLAYAVGAMVARLGCVLVCGGLEGVMTAAAQGAREAGGLTIGILPGAGKEQANPYIEIALPTTLGFSRNVIVAASADIIIALPGSHGTLSEICYGLVYQRPVIDLGGWGREGMIPAKDLQEAEQAARQILNQR